MTTTMKTPFRTSSYTHQNEACVEVGATDKVLIRDSKFKFREEQSPELGLSQAAFGALISQVKRGEYDL